MAQPSNKKVPSKPTCVLGIYNSQYDTFKADVLKDGAKLYHYQSHNQNKAATLNTANAAHQNNGQHVQQQQQQHQQLAALQWGVNPQIGQLLQLQHNVQTSSDGENNHNEPGNDDHAKGAGQNIIANSQELKDLNPNAMEFRPTSAPTSKPGAAQHGAAAYPLHAQPQQQHLQQQQQQHAQMLANMSFLQQLALEQGQQLDASNMALFKLREQLSSLEAAHEAQKQQLLELTQDPDKKRCRETEQRCSSVPLNLSYARDELPAQAAAADDHKAGKSSGLSRNSNGKEQDSFSMQSDDDDGVTSDWTEEDEQIRASADRSRYREQIMIRKEKYNRMLEEIAKLREQVANATLQTAREEQKQQSLQLTHDPDKKRWRESEQPCSSAPSHSVAETIVASTNYNEVDNSEIDPYADGYNTAGVARIVLDGHQEYTSYLHELHRLLTHGSAKQRPSNNSGTAQSSSSSNACYASNSHSNGQQRPNSVPVKQSNSSGRWNNGNNDDDDEKKNDKNHQLPFAWISPNECPGCQARDELYQAQLNECWSKIWAQSTIIQKQDQITQALKRQLENPSNSPVIATQLKQIKSASPPKIRISAHAQKTQQKKKHKAKNETKYESYYDPPSSFRTQTKVQISRKLTEEIIPKQIKEDIPKLFVHMNKVLASSKLHDCFGADDDDVKSGDQAEEAKIIDFGFHQKDDKKTQLFCIMEPCNHGEAKWKLNERLYTKDKLNASKKSLTTLSRPEIDWQIVSQIEQRIVCVLSKTKWSTSSRMRVFGNCKKGSKQRKTLHILTQEFGVKCIAGYKQLKEKNPDLLPIPILMFGAKKDEYWIEYVQITRIADGVDIGISFAFDEKKDDVFVSGIHLQKERISQQHALLSPHGADSCKCLDTFTSHIDMLRIGHLDEDTNKIKHYLKVIESLKEALSNKNDSDTQSNSDTGDSQVFSVGAPSGDA